MTARFDPEAELRAIWTAKGVPPQRQDEMIEQIAAKAAPGAMVGPFRIDATHAGEQAVIPGAERATDAQMAQRQANTPLKPKAVQQPCDVGLFGDAAQQKELF